MIGVTSLLGRNDRVVLAVLKEVRVLSGIPAGTVLELSYEVKRIGVTSIEIFIAGHDMLTGKEHLTGSAVFVTVDEYGVKTPHGLE